MVAHADLTGSNIHEPKGADSASADEVFVADGAGSGTFEKITTDSIDTTSVLNVNKFTLSVVLDDISTSSTIYVPVTRDCTLDKVTSALQGAIGTADATITIANYVGTTSATMVVAYSGSAAGDIDTVSPASNNTFTGDTFLRISTDGASSNTVKLILTLEFTLT